MLVMSPAAKKMLRKAQRRERDAQRGRLGENRHGALVQRVAAFMRQEWEEGRTPSKLNHEAAVRTGIRTSLCRQGWAWSDADDMARDIVVAALNRIGAKRPTWLEGQPAHFQDGASVPRERCLCCGATLLGEIGVSFCSRGCRRRWTLRIRDKIETDDRRAVDAARVR